MRRVIGSVRRWGALTWVGLAWLAGPVPGFGDHGVTGQPTGELWWWQLAAGMVVLVALVDAVRSREFGERIDTATLRAWSPGRRWRTVVVTGWLALAALAGVQVVRGLASWGDVTTFVAAAALLGFAPRRSVGGEAVPRLAGGTLLLALAAVVAFGVAASGRLDDPFAYYRIKQQVTAPVGAHNVLAGFLLAGAPAVALASVRRPRRWWPALVLVGLGLGATLSRGALAAGALAAVVAWLLLRDRTVAGRVGVAVMIAAVCTTGTLAALGAPNPDVDGPTSVIARTALWDTAFDAARQRPVTGVGLDGFLTHSRDAVGLSAPHEHAHSLPLHAAGTLGLPGLVATLAVWLGIAAGALGQLDRDRRTLVLVGLVGLGSLALVDEIALRPATVGLLALLATVVAAPRDPTTAVRLPPRRSD